MFGCSPTTASLKIEAQLKVTIVSRDLEWNHHLINYGHKTRKPKSKKYVSIRAFIYSTTNTKKHATMVEKGKSFSSPAPVRSHL